MNRKITAFCSIMIALSVCVAVFGVNGTVKTDLTTATVKVFYAENNESTTKGSLGELVSGVVGGIGDGSSGLGDSLGGLGGGSSNGLGDVVGGLGDALGGIGDSFGDILGGVLGGGSGQKPVATQVQTTAADIGLIIPVPAATQTTTQETESNTSESDKAEGETVDYAATSNPYKKPTGEFSAGDEDDGIKWLQWIFIYTGYGLKDNGITGVLDDDTVAIIKKLQHENNLTVDGNVTEDVINAAEVLYYQSVLGDGGSAIEVLSQTTTGESVSYAAVDSEEENEIPVALLVAVLVIIWIAAILGIVLLFVFKKKKIASQRAAEKEQSEKTGVSESGGKGTISGISDLFEEADKKNK